MGEARTMRLMGMEVPAGNDPASVYRRIQMMEQLTERSMTIPGIGYPIGMDAVIGLIPVLGDIFGVAMGSYIVWEARNLNMPKWHMARMVGNVAIDGVIGFVPLVGDVAGATALQNGVLADVSPTLLDLMDLQQPPEMTGHSLITQVGNRRAGD